MERMGRREFLRKAGVGLLTPYVVSTSMAAGEDPFEFSPIRPASSVFPQSIASGDPTASGVVLWTRIRPGVLDPDRALAFQVARSAGFRDIVFQGTVAGQDIRADHDYTVHIDLDGRLEPATVYYYRFIYDRTTSRTGRCRTLPAPGSSPERLKFAVVSCQDFTNGYYGAFSHIALELDIAFVVHVGDIIYETTGDTDFQSSPFPDRAVRLPSGANIALDLDDYRALYRRYRSDPWFQMVLEYHTFIVIWDDHETANDCYWDYDRDTLGVPDHPYQTDPAYGNDPATLRQLKLDSQRAWAEYVPTRARFDLSAAHPHDALTVYRRFAFGDLVELFITDQRTYRSAHPCGEDTFGERLATKDCPQRSAPGQTMLGEAQLDWFLNGLSSSSALWTAWGNEVFLGEISLGKSGPDQIIVNVDAWDGFVAERDLILRTVRDAGVRNLVALTGDMHAYLASYVKLDYADRSNADLDNVVGVEFMTPSITSSNIAEIARVQNPPRPDPSKPLLAAYVPQYFLERLAVTTNPHIQFFNVQDWGYSTVEFNRTYCEYNAYRVDKSVNGFLPPREHIRRLRVAAGSRRIQKLPILSSNE